MLKRTALFLFFLVFLISPVSDIFPQTASPKGLSFDGVNDVAVISADPALDFISGTIEFWVKPTYNTLGYSPVLVAMRNTSQVRFSIHMGASRDLIGLWNGSNYISFNYAFNQDEWYHIAIVFNHGSYTDFDILINGADISTLAFGGQFLSTTSGINFSVGRQDGYSTDGQGEPFVGSIDELRIWDRVLSADQINQYIDFEREGDETGLIGYYKMNEGAGSSSANAVSGSVGDLTISGSTWTDGKLILDPDQHIQVSGSGTSAADGIYEPLGVYNNYPVYSNRDYMLFNTAVNTPPYGNLDTWAIGNNLYSTVTGGFAYYYNQTDNNINITPAGETFVLGGAGSNPVPSVTSTTDTLENSSAIKDGLYFNGYNGKVTSGVYDYTEETIEMWVKPTYSGKGYNPVIAASRDNTGSRFSIHMAGDLSHLGLWNNSGYYNSAFSFSQNTWHHIAVTISATTISFYVNGSLIGSHSATLNTGISGVPFTIGTWNSSSEGAGEPFSGMIDEVRIWNDVRSQSEISELMNLTLSGRENNLIEYYPFNEGSGLSAAGITTSGALSSSTQWTEGKDLPTPDGSGTSEDPYLISDLDDLRWLSNNSGQWDKYYKQTADIDASATSTWNDGDGFSPIAGYFNSTYYYFTGQYDGDYHSISNLNIDRNTTNYVGLFGYLNYNAVVKNLKIENVDITGQEFVGGLAAGSAANTVQILNCSVSGDITGNGNVGGLGGFIRGIINGCAAEVNISGIAQIGGLLGRALQADIDNCYSAVDITRRSGADLNIGLLIGTSFVNQVHYCYSSGNIVDSEGGSIAADKGFLGANVGSTTGSNFFNNDLSNQTSATGAEIKTAGEMKTLSTYIDAGWDFVDETDNGANDYWNMDLINGVYGSGYPFLSWQNGNVSLLPVELSSFEARIVTNSVILEWKTETEINNLGFEVERTINSETDNLIETDWENLGFVQGNGNSNSPKEYSFTDNPDQFRKYFYRLKQIDTDGAIDYSDIISIEFTLLPDNFILYQNYPNPFNPSTKIKFGLPVDSRVRIAVYNVLGEKVIDLAKGEYSAGYHEINMEASRFAGGVYIYSIISEGSDGSKFSSVKKMMLLK